MNNGIKPTRLYRLTGIKHCRRCIQDRMKAIPPGEQRDRFEAMKLMGLISASVLGVLTSFGVFFPLYDSKVTGPPPPCRVKKHKINQDPKNPCPPEEPPPIPQCKGEDDLIDDRKECKYK